MPSFVITVAMIDNEPGFAGGTMVAAAALAGITVFVLMQIRFSKGIGIAGKYYNLAKILFTWPLTAGFLAILFAFIWFGVESSWSIADVSVWLAVAFALFCIQLFVFIMSAFLLGLLKFR